VKTLGITANCTKERAADVLRRIAAKARELDLQLLADADTAALIGSDEGLSTEQMFERADVVMALGGDGTMLRAARELGGKDTPLIGVNIGGLGFLTSVAEDNLDHAMDCLARGDFALSDSAISESRVVRDGSTVAEFRSLNEVVLSTGPAARVVTLHVHIDGDYVTSYLCDGLIVSTPAGSTGHSLSAGGPILTPGTEAFVISLICPHTLSSRPLVVPDRREICVTVDESAGGLHLWVDGQVGQPLAKGDSVIVKRSDRSVRFIRLPGHSYFAVLRQKLHWSGKNV
jgi:NAD+ kinase